MDSYIFGEGTDFEDPKALERERRKKRIREITGRGLPSDFKTGMTYLGQQLADRMERNKAMQPQPEVSIQQILGDLRDQPQTPQDEIVRALMKGLR